MAAPEKRKHCSWLLLFVLVLIFLAATGVLVWLLVPFENLVDILPIFNESTPPETTTTPATTTLVPSQAPSAYAFEFNQCASRDNCCNGLDTICNLSVTETLFATAHNANSDKESGERILPNHNLPLEDALEAGYRGLALDICNCGDNHVLCHGLCTIGRRDLVEVLANIVGFLERNPTEILLLPTELNNEADQPVNITEVSQIVRTVPGLVDLLYIHEKNNSWPSLGELKESNKRVLFFHYNGPTCQDGSECPPGFHYWYDYAAETEFSFDNVESVENTTRSCEITRGGGSSKAFFGINNFVRIPSVSVSSILNAASFLDERINECSMITGLDTNLVMVDFWSEGDLLQVVQDRNRARAQNSVR